MCLKSLFAEPAEACTNRPSRQNEIVSLFARDEDTFLLADRLIADA